VSRRQFPNTQLSFFADFVIENYLKFVAEWKPHLHDDIFKNLRIYIMGSHENFIGLSKSFESTKIENLRLDMWVPNSVIIPQLCLPSVKSLYFDVCSLDLFHKMDFSRCISTLKKVTIYHDFVTNIKLLDVIASANLRSLEQIYCDMRFSKDTWLQFLQCLLDTEDSNQTCRWLRQNSVSLCGQFGRRSHENISVQSAELSTKIYQKHGISVATEKIDHQS